MHILSGEEETQALLYIEEAVELAKKSICYRSLCGSVLVSESEEIIGRGWNSPPNDMSLEYCLKDDLPDHFKSDKTCCLHAEQRAIMDALSNHPAEIAGSTIYFIRLDTDTQEILVAGEPYCTICSKFALDAGVQDFVLYREEGVCVWDTYEYNEVSFGRK